MTVKSLYLLVAKYNQTGSVVDRYRATRLRILGNEHYRVIDDALTQNDELTTQQLYNVLIRKFPNLCVSLSTVKRARYELGWVVTMPKYCQMIREANKAKRLAWCKKMIEEDESFDSVVFPDESSVMLESHRKKCYRRRGEPRKLKPKPKHPVKVHVWGGISKRGATSVVILQGS